MTEPPDPNHPLQSCYRDSRLYFILKCSQRLELSIVVATELQAWGYFQALMPIRALRYFRLYLGRQKLKLRAYLLYC